MDHVVVAFPDRQKEPADLDGFLREIIEHWWDKDRVLEICVQLVDHFNYTRSDRFATNSSPLLAESQRGLLIGRIGKMVGMRVHYEASVEEFVAELLKLLKETKLVS